MYYEGNIDEDIKYIIKEWWLKWISVGFFMTPRSGCLLD